MSFSIKNKESTLTENIDTISEIWNCHSSSLLKPPFTSYHLKCHTLIPPYRRMNKKSIKRNNLHNIKWTICLAPISGIERRFPVWIGYTSGMDQIYGGADDHHLGCRKVFLHSKQCKCCDTDKCARSDVASISVCYRVSKLNPVNSSF